jgi:hypothetical protein
MLSAEVLEEIHARALMPRKIPDGPPTGRCCRHVHELWVLVALPTARGGRERSALQVTG